MSTFGDYQSYKKYKPAYAIWKGERELADAQRLEYLKRNPSEINKEDIQRSQTLIRAIGIMDEYSQKRAEDMEVATETVVGMGLEFAALVGAALGALASKLKPVADLVGKYTKGNKNEQILNVAIPAVVGIFAASLAAFPLFAWAAKTEVSASRKGRFEAMSKDLKNPKAFAVLTPEQLEQAQNVAPSIKIDDDKKNIANVLKTFNNMSIDSKGYKAEKRRFDIQMIEDELHINDEMTPEEIDKAKREQQLLTKLVEKIDIASQDYAENAELAGDMLFTGILCGGALLDFALQKILGKLNVKSASKISVITKSLTILGGLVTSIFMSQISKQASRVGRHKIKQELMKNPAQLVYVDDKKSGEITDVQIKPEKKQGMFKFLKEIWKDNREYSKYKKTQAKAEKKFYKAIEKLELSPEQMKDAKRLQKNTFKTFNKVDEKSQKYSESIEALGKAIAYPINIIFSFIGVGVGMRYLAKPAKTSIQKAENFAKYMGVVFLSTIPSILINAKITTEQKKASRIADMLAINEMQDYRQFRSSVEK